MQDRDTLTAASSDETSVYKTPPEAQNSEVVTAKQEQVSQFFACSPTKALWSEMSRKKNIYFSHVKNVKPFSDWSS